MNNSVSWSQAHDSVILQFYEATRRSLVGDRRLKTHDEEEGDKTIGGSAMLLCGIVLPPFEKIEEIISCCSLVWTELAHTGSSNLFDNTNKSN